MYLMYIDRSGVLISSSFDILAKPLQFLRVLAGLVYADDKYLGYDTTISIENGAPTSATLSGIKYSVKNVVHAETGILGRGTVCLEVTDDDSGTSQRTTYALKDAWVDVTRAQKEVQILNKLNALNVTNIPILVRHEIVQVDGVNDSTQNIRNTLNANAKTLKSTKQPQPLFASPFEDQEVEENEAEAKNVGAASADEEKQNEDGAIKLNKWKRSQWFNYFAREHYRLLMWPFGRPLTAFRCLEELLLGIRDIIRAIQQLEKAGCLHRDISINNIVLADNDKKLVEFLKSQGINCHSSICADSLQSEGEGEAPSLVEESANNDKGNNNIDEDRSLTMNDLLAAAENKTSLPEDVRKRLEGFLIDFDYSIFIDREDSSALADRTGTVPFMAIEVLRATNFNLKHAYYHDLESLIYVLCWVCTVSAGPGIPRPSKEYPDSIVRKWNEEEPTEAGMQTVALSKEGYTNSDETFEKAILKGFHEYFKPIFKCLLGLRRCLFPTRQSDSTLLKFIIGSYKELKNDIVKNAVTDESQLQELKMRRLRLPLGVRDTDDVFQDLYDVIDEAVSALPAEHKLSALKDLPGEALSFFFGSRYTYVVSFVTPEPQEDTATKSKTKNCVTTQCTSEFMDKVMAARGNDVLTDMPDFPSRRKSKHGEVESGNSTLQDASGSIASSRSSRGKRKVYKEDNDDEESPKKPHTSIKKRRTDTDYVVRKNRKSLQARYDEAEFVP
ncbi:hypothetical protein SCHPADRAFT_1002990 [Schizopora paradoxa]|uniref:Fungal-type protein kinase domain-containing protein n=1 Tax=Schizopora paradoxa TaxID=27342 RepID=A0A0H2R728_9AGAM|nr:hypothetical protein SCHPADRAFT_1002990 [Schizopora paradoxa]